MISKTKISVICSGIRNYKWEQLYLNLSESIIDFELIIAGDVLPLKEMPQNFKHIYTEVKPAQCIEISAREAKGDLIMLISDDLYFSKNFLDEYYKFYNENCSESDISSSLFMRYGRFYESYNYQFWPGVKGSPYMPMSMMMKQSLWHKLGGIDNRFVALFGDLDLALRVMEIGGKIYFSKTLYVEEIMKDTIFNKIKNKISKLIFKKTLTSKTLFKEYGRDIDRKTLDNLWTKKTNKYDSKSILARKGKFIHLKKRLSNVITFDEYNILNASQGFKGRWK